MQPTPKNSKSDRPHIGSGKQKQQTRKGDTDGMNTQGHFRIIREIFNRDIFKNVVDFRLFFLILGQAMFKDGVPAGDIILERGEWLRSYRQLQKDLEYIDGRAVRQYGIATLKRSTERLTAEHLISTKKADSGTVFRVEKYNELQGIAEADTSNRGTNRGTP